MKECVYVDFLHHLCIDLYRVVVHSVIVRFKTLISVSIVGVLLSDDSSILGDYRMLLCSDVLCAWTVWPRQDMLPCH